jgi:hypothetical protein
METLNLGKFDTDEGEKPSSDSIYRRLKRKVETLEDERDRVLEEYNRKIEKLKGALEVLEDEIQQEIQDTAETDFPHESSLPEKIQYILRSERQIMKPRQIDKRIRQYESDLRQNAVAETVSRMASEDDGRLYRRKYSGSTHYYGLATWKTSDGHDFRNEFKPEEELV